MQLCRRKHRWKFQPTLPARGATLTGQLPGEGHKISTHAPRTGSDGLIAPEKLEELRISTHAPRTGSDPRGCRKPVRRVDISTHAPRTGSDTSRTLSRWLRRQNFNPRSPHGERQGKHPNSLANLKFQPTLPARGATAQSNNSVDQNHRLCTKSIPQNSPFEN